MMGSDHTRVEDLIRELFATADAMDVEANAALMTEDVEVRFGNDAPLIGREAFTMMSKAFLGTLGGISHAVDGLWITGDTAIAELTVSYTLPDSAVVTVPAADIIRVRDGLISDYRIFVDTTPLAQQA